MTKHSFSHASLLVVLAALLGCSSQVAGSGADGSTSADTDGSPTTTAGGTGGVATTWGGTGGGWPVTGTATVASCASPVLDCQYSADGCDCTGSCPMQSFEVVCTESDGGTQACTCLLDGSTVGTCTGPFPYGPYDAYYGCGGGETGLGCCDTLLP